MESSLTLDCVDQDEARRLLTACCGSTRWVERMLERRPFRSRERLLESARDIWFGLDRPDWLEAFSHHPKIGDLGALRARFASTGHLSEKEQAGVTGASGETLNALAAGNSEYESRFGYIFIVCATGLSADEMLERLRRRLTNHPEKEIGIAAQEQAKITELRLIKL